jgi:ribonuclease HII
VASSKSPPGPDPAGLFAFDRRQGTGAVAGTDEAGRGCLAGPIVAAAVLFDRQCIENRAGGLLDGLNDSKKLTAKARERLYPVVMRCAARVSVSMRSARYIDANGLHVSNREVLAAALVALDIPPDTSCFVDGFNLPDCPVAHQQLVKGDSTSAAVAAASIVAKVTRDRYMVRVSGLYPEYGLDGHKGYASEAHRDAIREFGPTPIHRMSFRSSAYGESVDQA